MRKGSDDSFFFFVDFVFADDDFVFAEAPKTSKIPSAVEEYYILALADESGLQATFSRILTLGDTAQKRKVLGQLIEKWATVGDYRRAISGAILSDQLDDDKWFTIAKIALNRDELPALQSAIRQHRAKQATTAMSMTLCLELLTRQDARARDVWDDFIAQARRLRPTVGKGHILLVATYAMMLVALPDEEAKLTSQFITFLNQDENERRGDLLALQFASTLFDKHHIQTFYALCADYWDAMRHSRLRTSGIFGDFDETLNEMGRVSILFIVFQLRQYDFITPWIGIYEQLCRDDVEGIYEMTCYRAWFWGFIQQPSRIKRMLLLMVLGENYGRGDMMNMVYPIFNRLCDLLSNQPLSQFRAVTTSANDFFFGMDTIAEGYRTSEIMKRAFLALPFLYPNPDERHPSHLSKVILFNRNVDAQVSLEAMLSYACILALTDDPLFDEAISAGIHWGESAEEALDMNFKSKTSVPIELLAQILTIFLAQADLPRAEAYLKRLSAKVVWYVLGHTITTIQPLAESEKPETWDALLWADLTQMQQNALQTFTQLVFRCVQTHPISGALRPVAQIVDLLHEAGMEQDAIRLSEHIADAKLDWGKPESEEAVEMVMYDKPNSRRALKLAKERSASAKSTFDEVIRQARIDQTKGIKKPQDVTLAQLVGIITQTNTTDIILTQLSNIPKHYQRQRDKILLEVVRNWVNNHQLDDAKRAVAMMTVIPIKIQAQTILAEALASNQQAEIVTEWIAHADGRMNLFWLRCAYALGLLKIGHADAQGAVQTALAIIPKLPRPSFMATAWAFYACGLVRIGHVDAPKMIEQALSAIRATPDLTSRFYTAFDMVAVLLDHHHPMSADVVAYLKTVLRDNAISGTVAIGTPIWEMSAHLDLAKLLSRHGQTAEADALITQASTYQAQTRYMAWDMGVKFASITTPASLKTHLDELGALRLNEILELILAWGNVFDQLEAGLAHQITHHMLRLFGWVGYEVGDLGYLAKG